jgi:iron complex transport system ATP-binding protein
MSILALNGASVLHANSKIIDELSFSVSRGQMVGLLGPNGAGKTTAARALLGLQKLHSGQATIDGSDVTRLSTQERARLVAYLPQTRAMAWPISVRELVALGRFAVRSGLRSNNNADMPAIEAALQSCDLTHLASRSITTLSGGEVARVHLARALAAETNALVVDEPTNALDPRHSFDVLSRLRQRAREGAAVLIILHDLAAAARYCDEIILLDRGKCIAQGAPRLALSRQNLAQTYQIEAKWAGADLHILGPSLS